MVHFRSKFVSFVVLFVNVSCFDFGENDQLIVYPRVIEDRGRRAVNTFPDDIMSTTYSHPATETKLKIIQVGDWTIELNSESNLVVAPGLEAEWISGNGDGALEALHRSIDECDYKLGKISSDAQGGDTNVAMAICNDRFFTGYINAGGNVFLLEPNTTDDYESTPPNASNDPHRLYRRIRRFSAHKFNELKHQSQHRLEAEMKQAPDAWLFNLTGDMIDIGDGIELQSSQMKISKTVLNKDNSTVLTSSVGKSWHQRQFEDEEDDVGYFYDSAWTYQSTATASVTKSNLSERWLEIAVAADHTLIAFHGKSKVEQYVLSLMNIVNAIYRDSSLGANLHLVVARLILYKHKKHSVVRAGDAKKSLENVNEWNRKLLAGLCPGARCHHLAVWLTRADIGGPSGYAPVGGVCDPKRSCALNRDEGLSSAFIIAHEMAHVLGLSHDGDATHSNDCDGGLTSGSVMAPLVSATFHQFAWSKCSREEFKQLFNKWACLSDQPPSNKGILLNSTLQNTFSMDEQCRMEFGEGYKSCRAFDIHEPCSHLWCGHEQSPLVCKTKKGSPLEGTQCGINKWCRSGYCEDMSLRYSSPVLLNPQDGGWSDWSSWGPCSRSCGMGVQFSTRKCNNPTPLHGGNECDGINEKWRICNKKACPEPLSDMRAQQCKRLPKLLNLIGKREWNMTWLPFESNKMDKKCKLICISQDTKQLFEAMENLIDGTPCSYENSDNICIQGVCQALGCDGTLLSSMKTDMCGVCGGNNSNCTSVETNIRKNLKREVTRVAVIPRMATQIRIEANVTMPKNDESTVAFILKNRKKKKYTITIPHINKAKSEIIEGTKFFYDKLKTRHEIRAKGPILAEMVILVYAPSSEIEKGLNVSLRSEYIINKVTASSSPLNRFRWVVGGWGPCSASCGGGKRQKTVACYDDENRHLVRRKHCSLMDKPLAKYEKCNVFDCHFQWYPGEWEPCSSTCGLEGVQSRELYCLPKAVLGRLMLENNGSVVEKAWTHMVNPTRCSGITPTASRPCNRQPCFSFWSYGQWSQCSASCGEGFKYRLSYCPPPTGESFFSCGEAPPMTQKQICYGDSKWSNKLCKNTKKNNCQSDESDFCSLDLLEKYCKIGGFRKICCKSCAK